MVSNQIFRERYQSLAESEDLTLAEVALRLGWYSLDRRTGTRKPDSSRVSRVLGIACMGGERRQKITDAHAVELCNALHLEYWQADV